MIAGLNIWDYAMTAQRLNNLLIGCGDDGNVVNEATLRVMGTVTQEERKFVMSHSE